jgi:hypothetical protein
MRNPELEKLNGLVGSWDLTMSDMWFLDEGRAVMHGHATIEWLGDAFLVLRSEMEGKPEWDYVIGRSDADDRYVVLYHDHRGVCRLFDMTFGDGRWVMERANPDFHQRMEADVTQDRIDMKAFASDDRGETWRKDLDLTFTRVGE